MRRAYISPHVELTDSYRIARTWAGANANITIVGPSTSAVDASPWLAKTGHPIGTTGNRHSRYTARPRTGTVIAWCLPLDDLLNLERRPDLDAIVLIRGYNEHAPWITAHNTDFLGGQEVEPISEASAIIKETIKGISTLPILNQGIIDSRDRSMAVRSLTALRSRGYTFDPKQLVVEAIRNDWPGDSPLALADIAKKLNAGKRLRTTA